MHRSLRSSSVVCPLAASIPHETRSLPDCPLRSSFLLPFAPFESATVSAFRQPVFLNSPSAMSPIISFRDDEPKPPPFPGRTVTTPPSSSSSSDNHFAAEPPAYSNRDVPPGIKPPGHRKHARSISGDYGAYERDDGDAEDGLLEYEMDVLDGQRSAPASPVNPGWDSPARRRERGELIIRGGPRAGGWLGLRKPSPAAKREIIGIIREVSRTGPCA